MLTHEDIYDSASFGCVDGSNLLHLCFNYPSESEMDVVFDKNEIFSAFFFYVVKLYETYPQVLIKKSMYEAWVKHFLFVCLKAEPLFFLLHFQIFIQQNILGAMKDL